MRLLVIEDDKELCDAVCYQLKENGYQADFCHDGETGIFYASQDSYDVIILDRMLPEVDGLAILKSIRSKGNTTPVIMVTAMDRIHDRIDGLDSGADDYLVKPFDIQELLARIRALTRRPGKLQHSDVLTFSNLTLNPSKLLLSSDTGECTLSKRENELMEYFFRNCDQTLARVTIINHVWGLDSFIEDGNLDNYIYFLRRRLRSIGSKAQIKTIHSVGYRFQSAEPNP